MGEVDADALSIDRYKSTYANKPIIRPYKDPKDVRENAIASEAYRICNETKV